MGQLLPEKEILSEDLDSLAAIFDMLAQYDFEDEQKNRSEASSGSLVSAPRELERESDSEK